MDALNIRVYIVATLLMWYMDCKLALAKEITCYCNTPYCRDSDVTTCTSQLGKCFSQQTINTNQPDIHGCAEQLQSDEQASCLGAGDVLSRKQGSDYTLMCCQADSCNSMDWRRGVMDMDIDVETGNGSLFSESASRNGDSKRYSNSDQTNQIYYSSKELWFKAAVIAVPIAGGFILIMLVLLAVRMLRRDSQRHREFKHHQSMAKAQLFVADHFDNNKLLQTYVTCDDHKTNPLKQCSNVTKACQDESNPHLSGINHKSICRETAPSHSVKGQAQSHAQSSPTLSSQKDYPYEKLHDSTKLLDNPQESVVMIWPEKDKSNTKDPMDIV